MTEKTLPTAEELREAFCYDPETGFLRWRKSGVKVTCRHHSGYIVVGFHKRQMLVHRVIWCMVTGKWPADQIDHINLKCSDNRWINLREATHADNVRNIEVRVNSTTGIKGVFQMNGSKKRWYASIKLNGKRIRLGGFGTAAEASEAYNRRARLEFGEFFRPSRAVLGDEVSHRI